LKVFLILLNSIRMGLTHKAQFNKRHGFDKETAHSLTEISKLSGLKKSVLQEVFVRGVGAYNTNPSSVRPHIKSPEQWGQARLYAFVNKIEGNKMLDHDVDLLLKL